MGLSAILKQLDHSRAAFIVNYFTESGTLEKVMVPEQINGITSHCIRFSSSSSKFVTEMHTTPRDHNVYGFEI